MDLRRTDEWNKFYPTRLLADDDGGVGGEAWTCDGQTNGINFIQLVCPSPWWLDGSG
jgi:hypothetical protein